MSPSRISQQNLVIYSFCSGSTIEDMSWIHWLVILLLHLSFIYPHYHLHAGLPFMMGMHTLLDASWVTHANIFISHPHMARTQAPIQRIQIPPSDNPRLPIQYAVRVFQTA